MNNLFILLPKAQFEIIEAWEWYEDKQMGLGDRFQEEVEKKIGTVVRNPLHYPVKGKYRQAQTDVFPFLIVFTFDKKENMIYIVSVFHMSRHPDKKH